MWPMLETLAAWCLNAVGPNYLIQALSYKTVVKAEGFWHSSDSPHCIQYVYIVCYVRNRTQDFSSATIKIENLLAKSVVVVPPPAAGTLTLLLLFIL